MTNLPPRAPVAIPEGSLGVWSIEHIHLKKPGPIAGSLAYPGDYTVLKKEGIDIIMSDTAQEYYEHEPLWMNAKGSVLIGGLGLGMVITPLLADPRVEKITLIENSPEVIDLVWPHYQDLEGVHLVVSDFEAWESTEKFNYVWHDTWIADNELDRHEYREKMTRKYEDRCDDMGFWVRREDVYAIPNT